MTDSTAVLFVILPKAITHLCTFHILHSLITSVARHWIVDIRLRSIADISRRIMHPRSPCIHIRRSHRSTMEAKALICHQGSRMAFDARALCKHICHSRQSGMPNFMLTDRPFYQHLSRIIWLSETRLLPGLIGSTWTFSPQPIKVESRIRYNTK